MGTALRTSEFWVGLAVLVGQYAATHGLLPPDLWDKLLYPALVYITARLAGKGAKSFPAFTK